MFDIRIISPSLFLWEYYNTKNRYKIKITYRNATIKLLLSFFEARHSSFVETLAKDHVYLLNNTLTRVMISTAHICMLNVPMRYFHHFLSDVPLSAGTQHPFWSWRGKGERGGGRTKIFLSKKGMGMLASRGIRNPGEGGGLRIPTITTISLSISWFSPQFFTCTQIFGGGGQLCDNLIFSMLI